MAKEGCNEMDENGVLDDITVLTFEEALAQLEAQVAILESGSATLDASMKAFIKGTELARLCQKKLDEAERKIMELTENEAGEIEELPFPDKYESL